MKKSVLFITALLIASVTLAQYTPVTVQSVAANGISGPLVNTAELATQAGDGVTSGTGTVYKTAVKPDGKLQEITMLIDLTGLSSKDTLGDIIGTGTNAAHFGAIAAGEIGTLMSIRIECLELPAGGEEDIDIYSATEATGVYDGAIGDLTEAVVYARAANWAAGDVRYASALPAAGKYLYLTVGTDSTPVAGVYTAGQFLVTFIGYK